MLIVGERESVFLREKNYLIQKENVKILFYNKKASYNVSFFFLYVLISK